MSAHIFLVLKGPISSRGIRKGDRQKISMFSSELDEYHSDVHARRIWPCFGTSKFDSCSTKIRANISIFISKKISLNVL